MKKLIIICLVLIVVLQGCDINIMNGVSINSVDSKYQFRDYEGYLDIKDDIESDDDYYSYDIVERHDVSDVELYTIFEDIEIIEESRDDVEVKYFVVYNPKLSDDGPEAIVTKNNTFKVDIQWDDFRGKAHGMMVVRIPKDFDESLLVDTVSGEVLIEGVDGKELKVETVSGNIDVNRTTFGDMNLDSTSGEITVRASEATGIICDTTSGDINLDVKNSQEMNLESTSGDIEVDTDVVPDAKMDVVSGDVEIRAKELKGDLSIDTVSGSVHLLIDRLDAEVDYETVSGDFRTNKDMRINTKTNDDVKGIIGSGKHTISVDTTSGDFTID